MPFTQPKTASAWSPLYFLASVGAGGIAVTFFMYLMFWVPHPGQPVPVFEDISRAFAGGGIAMQGMIIVAMAAIAVFAALNLRLLAWNLSAFGAFRRSDAWAKLMGSNAQTQVLALPLALAMSVNVMFVLGLVFVPGLWSVVEYLFPLALIAFAAIGALALAQIGAFLGRVLGKGGFNCAANNSFGQMLPAFALSMVGVGMAAPAALSGSALVAGTALIVSSFFMMAAVMIAAVALILGFRSMMENGAAAESAPTLMIVIPLLTVVGIMMMRQSHGLHVHFGVNEGAGETLVFLTRLLAVQLVFGLLGMVVLRVQGYGARFLSGREKSAGSYALVCPGVALSVMLHFWINKGLVEAGMLAKFGTAYWTLSALAVLAQVAMIWLVIRLHRIHFARQPLQVAAVPAE